MSHIKSKDTAIEVKVRSYMFRQGFRFRKNLKSLPGKPDIVFPKYKIAVFIHGCFWHRHNCKRATMPKTKIDYWTQKFKRNLENDRKHVNDLNELGWKAIVLWECEINNDFENTMVQLINSLTEQSTLSSTEV